MADSDQTKQAPPPSGRSFATAAALFAQRRTLVMLLLGFAAGLPNLLIFDTISTWLREAGLSLQTISFFALATLSYSLKFIWAPLVDRTAVPLLTKSLGHRRSWMLVSQCVVIVGLFMIAATDPAHQLARMGLAAVVVGFAGATQDIVIDAWRIEAATTVDQQGPMLTAYQWGYRGAMIVAGALPLILATRVGWNVAYAVMASMMGIGVIAVLFAPREAEHKIRPIPVGDIQSRPIFEVVEWVIRLALIGGVAIIVGTGLSGQTALASSILQLSKDQAVHLQAIWSAKPSGVYLQLTAVLLGLMGLVLCCWPIPGFRTRPGAYLAGSFGLPLKDFFRRFGGLAGFILALICLYRLSDFVLNIMSPFYLDLGFSKDEIAEVRKIFGVVATMGGVTLAGIAIARLGVIRSMIIGSFSSPISHLVFAWLATQGHHVPALYIAIGVDNIAAGFAGTILIAYMSSLTSIGFTATQYALFSSLYALPGKLIASQSGRLVEAAAHSAEGGGILGKLKPLFANLPAESLTKGAAMTGVSPAALGAGYITFFFYASALGVFGITLALYVARRQSKLQATAA